MRGSNQNRIRAGIVLLLLAVYLGGLGIFYPRLPADLLHAPRWIFYLSAVLVGFGSGLAFLGQSHANSKLLAAVIWILFAVLGSWAALFSSLENLSGGWAIFTPDTNRMLARIIFGLGAVLNLGAGIYAGWSYIKE